MFTSKETKQKATNFDTIVQAIVGANADLKAEDVTVEDIVSALTAANDDNDASAIQQQLDAANTRIATLETELGTKNTRIAELEAEQKEKEDAPAEETAEISSQGEADGKEMTLAQFADKNAGDTQAILARAKKEGLI